MKEVEHRTKNMLATVQSIVQLTRRTSGTVEAYADTLIGRIRAMSRAHDLLSRQHWHGARLHDLVRAELGAYPDPDGARAAIAGDDPLVTPRAAQTLSLALHELATNAARYGALSAPGGRVTFRSAVHLASAPSLALEWLESGGPPVAPPTRSGFGRLVLERSVAHDLGGEAQLEFAPAGVRYQVRAPLAGVALVEDDGRDAEREAVSWRQS